MKKYIGTAALIVVCLTQTSFVQPLFGQRSLPSICSCKGYSGPGGACYAGPGGPAYDGPGGPAYRGPGGACYAGPGGPAYDGPGGPAYSGPSGPCCDLVMLQAPIFDFLFNPFTLLDDGLYPAGIGNS